MKKQLKKSVIILSLAMFACLWMPAAFANEVKSECKIAVVDVPKVVIASAQVKALQKNNDEKIEELENWLKTIRSEIAKQSTDEAKQKLIKKYDSEYTKKLENLKKEYKEKLEEIDKNISEVIANEAKQMGYEIVITKKLVLYGGNDITEEIIKKVK